MPMARPGFNIFLVALQALSAVALAGCGTDAPPPPPQRHDQLSQAIHQPLDKAHQAEQDVQKAAEAQRRAMDAAEAGEAPPQ